MHTPQGVIATRHPPERVPWLVVFPLFATAGYYILPDALQQSDWLIFAPQLTAYLSLLLWMALNTKPWARLGLDRTRFGWGVRQGSVIGLALAAVNLSLILFVIPGLGGDVAYLRETPHARAPVWLMFPFGIVMIAILVELNFRGFQLGRLLALFGPSILGRAGAVVLSAFAFAWDPFMVHVFQSLHWMAASDGLVWGILLLRTETLYATMAAHTIEVWILYVSLKLWFG